MGRNLEKIIAIALAICTVSAVEPATNVNLLMTKVYAACNDTDTLHSLELDTSSGNTIKLYSASSYDSSDKVASDEVEADTTYYAKTSSDTISIKIDGPSSKYVRVFKGTSSSTKGKKVSSDISLSDSTTTLVIKVYGEEPDSSIRYDQDDDYDLLNTYKVKVKYTGSSSSSDSSSSDLTADDYDSIYLDKLSIDGESITLKDSKIDYSYDVNNDVNEVTIKAVPQDTDTDTVTIDGNDVDDSLITTKRQYL